MHTSQQTDFPNDEVMLSRYRRAEAMEHENVTASTELNARAVPQWLADGHRFWYTRINKIGTQYRLVDAKAATNTVAFDHQKLAIALSKATGESIAETDLPISDLDFSDVSLSFNAFGKSWTFDGEASLTEGEALYPDHWLVSR